jgi:hypothetical protein
MLASMKVDRWLTGRSWILCELINDAWVSVKYLSTEFSRRTEMREIANAQGN